MHAILYCAGGYCAYYEDAQNFEASATVRRSAESTIFSIQTTRTCHQGDPLFSLHSIQEGRGKADRGERGNVNECCCKHIENNFITQQGLKN